MIVRAFLRKFYACSIKLLHAGNMLDNLYRHQTQGTYPPHIPGVKLPTVQFTKEFTTDPLKVDNWNNEMQFKFKEMSGWLLDQNIKAKTLKAKFLCDKFETV